MEDQDLILHTTQFTDYTRHHWGWPKNEKKEEKKRPKNLLTFPLTNSVMQAVGLGQEQATQSTQMSIAKVEVDNIPDWK